MVDVPQPGERDLHGVFYFGSAAAEDSGSSSREKEATDEREDTEVIARLPLQHPEGGFSTPRRSIALYQKKAGERNCPGE